MFWEISQNPANRQQDRALVPANGVINAFDPVRTDTAVDSLYNNNGSVGALGAFARIGLFPVTPGEPFTITLSAGPKNWVFNAARINFYSANDATIGNLVSSVTAGVTMSSDLQTISCAGASVPVGAAYAATNVKYTVNSVYSSANVIPTGALDDLLPYVMLCYGADAACLTDFGDGTVEESTTVPDLDGKLSLARHGEKLFIRTAYSATKDLVHRIGLEQQNFYYNSDFQFLSYVQIPTETIDAEVVGAFASNYTGTPSDPDTLYIESDNSPAYQINGLFQGGNHGIPCWIITAAAHGLDNMMIGRTYSKGGKVYTGARVVNANSVVLAAPVSGGASDWAVDTASPGTGTFTALDGGADIVATAVASAQLYPSLQNVERTVLIDNGKLPEANGIYNPRRVRVHIDYNIPNVKAVYESLWARAGTSAEPSYNDPAIDPQVGVHLEYVFDAYGATSVRYEVEAIQAHSRTYMWPSQHQALTFISASSETLWFLNPVSVSFQAGLNNDAGDARDFSQWANITSNTSEYYAKAVGWKPASFWSDNTQRPPRAFAFEVRNSGGTPIKRYVMVNSAIQGRTAANDYSDIAHFLSAAEKSYMAVAYNEAMTAGDVTTTVGGWGFMDLTLDSEADINFAFPLFGGGYEWIWSSRNGALTDYAIPLPPQLSGRQIEVVNRSASATVSIDGDAVTVTTTDDAYITFRAV